MKVKGVKGEKGKFRRIISQRYVLLLLLLAASIGLQVAIAAAGSAQIGVQGYGYGPTSRYVIRDDISGGDCGLIGTWDGPSKTCTMTADVEVQGDTGGQTYGIEIADSGIALNGDGHVLSSGAAGQFVNYGVVADGVTGVAIRNLTVQNSGTTTGWGFSAAFYLTNSSACTLENNTVSGGDVIQQGISLQGSDGITIKGNNIHNAGFPAILLSQSNSNQIENNQLSNNDSAISLTGDSMAGNYSDNNILKNNSAVSNQYGGFTILGSGNMLDGNSITGSNGYMARGIMLEGPGNVLRGNTMSGNTVNFTVYGFTVSGNTVSFTGNGEEYNNDIDISNTVEGKPLYYVRNARGQTFDSSTNAGAFYCINCANVTIKDITSPGHNDAAVFVYGTHDSTIQNIVSTGDVTGISLKYSNSNTVKDSHTSGNTTGIGINNSTNNLITNNTANNNHVPVCEHCKGGMPDEFGAGLILYASNGNTLQGNHMSDNDANFSVSGYPEPGVDNDVDNSNTVQGKPILYLKDVTGSDYGSSTNAGTVYCIRCDDVGFYGLVLNAGSNAGFFFYDSHNSEIRNANVSGYQTGIRLIDSSNIAVAGDDVKNSEYRAIDLDGSNNVIINNTKAADNQGMGIGVSGDDNMVVSSYISGNVSGIYFQSGSGNVFRGNTIKGNNVGMSLFAGYYGSPSSGNYVSGNNFDSNGTNIIDSSLNGGSTPVAAYNDPVTGEGNYWSNYNTPAQGCNDANSDGFCDAPYVIASSFWLPGWPPPAQIADSKPWVTPYGWDEQAPSVSGIAPTGTVSTTSTALTADLSDADISSGIDTSSVAVKLDGNTVEGCSVTFASVSCPVSGLTTTTHTINVSVSDFAGNPGSASATFSKAGDPMETRFQEKWNALGGLPGPAAGGILPLNGGQYRAYTNGRLYYNASSDQIYWVHGSILGKYDALGGATGFLGLPTSDEHTVTGVAGAVESDFAGGAIYWGPGVGAIAMGDGSVRDKYLSGGGPAAYGLPTGDQQNVIKNGSPTGGKYQTTQRAVVTWNGDGNSQAFAVYGGIMWMYMKLGGPSGPYGVATTDEIGVQGVPGGRESDFESGRLFWSINTGTHGLQGTFLDRYLDAANGGPAGCGLPISDAYQVWGGYAQNMQNAYVTILPGATEGKLVRGGVYAKYKMLGGPGGALHLITAEEHAIPGIPGAPDAVQADFQNGYVFWSTATSSHPVNGGIYIKYLSVGGPTGHLGLPMSDEYSIPLAGGGVRQAYQHGFITWGAWYGTWADLL